MDGWAVVDWTTAGERLWPGSTLQTFWGQLRVRFTVLANLSSKNVSKAVEFASPGVSNAASHGVYPLVISAQVTGAVMVA